MNDPLHKRFNEGNLDKFLCSQLLFEICVNSFGSDVK